jgi:hypothetical protein
MVLGLTRRALMSIGFESCEESTVSFSYNKDVMASFSFLERRSGRAKNR